MWSEGRPGGGTEPVMKEAVGATWDLMGFGEGV